MISTVGRFYDPLGFIQPVIIRYKVFIQELCRKKVLWNEPLEGILLGMWQSLAISLRECQPIQTPRCYISLHTVVLILSMDFVMPPLWSGVFELEEWF